MGLNTHKHCPDLLLNWTQSRWQIGVSHGTRQLARARRTFDCTSALHRAQNSGNVPKKWNVPHTSCARARAALLRAEPPTAGLSAWTAGAKRACGASVKAAYRAVTPKGTLCFESDTARQMGNHWHVTTRCERIAKLSGPRLGRESMPVRSPASWMKVEKYSQSRARGVGGTPTRRGLARSPHASHRTTGVCNIWILRKKQWHQAVVF